MLFHWTKVCYKHWSRGVMCGKWSPTWRLVEGHRRYGCNRSALHSKKASLQTPFGVDSEWTQMVFQGERSPHFKNPTISGSEYTTLHLLHCRCSPVRTGPTWGCAPCDPQFSPQTSWQEKDQIQHQWSITCSVYSYILQLKFTITKHEYLM